MLQFLYGYNIRTVDGALSCLYGLRPKVCGRVGPDLQAEHQMARFDMITNQADKRKIWEVMKS